MPIYPKISIVTPSYNRSTYLEKTILSILDQEYSNLEYIIIDGGSTDGSVYVIKKYASQLAYWVSEPDKGQSDALNKGIQMATGEIIAELDTDDLYLPGTLNKIAEYFSQHPDVEFVYGDLVVINEQGKQIFLRKTIPYDYKAQLYGYCVVPQPSSFWRRSIFERVGYFDTSLHYSMDLDFFIRCGKKGIRFGHIPQPLACFRLNAAQKTQQSEFARSIREVNLTYVKRIFGNDWMNNAALSFLKWFYRAKTYAVRTVIRGDMIPFRSVIALAREKRKNKG